MRIAAYQFAVSGNIIQNLNTIEKAICKAESQNVSLVVFPECCLTGYPPRDIPRSSDVDFNMVSKACLKLQRIADDKGISFIVGTIYKENDNIFNRAILFQPDRIQKTYDKRALWGWDKENFIPGNSNGIFAFGDIIIGVRVCFEVRFPEFFREMYCEKTDLNIILFYDVSDTEDIERYHMMKGHIQTRAVENVCTTISVNAIAPFQTAPTAIFGRSGQLYEECERNKEGFIVYDFEKQVLDFGELGRKELSDSLLSRNSSYNK